VGCGNLRFVDRELILTLAAAFADRFGQRLGRVFCVVTAQWALPDGQVRL